MSRKFINSLKFFTLLLRKEGLFKAVGNFKKISSKNSRLQTLKIAGYKEPIYFRSNSTDVHLVKSILYAEEYNVDLRGVSPLNVVDVGANVGYTSIYFSNKFPNARVFSFEPEPESFDLLLKNAEAYSNVILSNEAIWSVKTKLSASSEKYDSWSFGLKESSEEGLGENFQAIAVNDILERIDGEIDILKMDIEGAEKDLFIPENTAWLKFVKVIIIELHDRKIPGCSESLYKSLIFNEIKFTQKNEGYNTVIYNESFFAKKSKFEN